MFESHPELDGLESIPDTSPEPSPILSFIAIAIVVAGFVSLTFIL